MAGDFREKICTTWLPMRPWPKFNFSPVLIAALFLTAPLAPAT